MPGQDEGSGGYPRLADDALFRSEPGYMMVLQEQGQERRG